MSFYDTECPYCGENVEINTDDGYGLEEDKTYQQECPHCEKNFVYTTSIIIVHHAEKADCLNGASHDFQPVTHYPRCWPDWVRCTVCDEEKQGRYDGAELDRIRSERTEAST